MTPGLRAAAKRARDIAGGSISPADHRVALAIEAAVHAADHPPPVHDPALLADLPAWSDVRRRGTSEGPLR